MGLPTHRSVARAKACFVYCIGGSRVVFNPTNLATIGLLELLGVYGRGWLCVAGYFGMVA